MNERERLLRATLIQVEQVEELTLELVKAAKGVVMAFDRDGQASATQRSSLNNLEAALKRCEEGE